MVCYPDIQAIQYPARDFCLFSTTYAANSLEEVRPDRRRYLLALRGSMTSGGQGLQLRRLIWSQ
jgi:hypothetical protein